MSAYRCGDCHRKDERIDELIAKLDAIYSERAVLLTRSRIVLKRHAPLRHRMRVLGGALKAVGEVFVWVVGARMVIVQFMLAVVAGVAVGMLFIVAALKLFAP